jgi:transcriptional regulator with XRE-family HTH domain
VQDGQLRTHRQLRGWSQDDLVRELVGLGIELGERQLGVSASLISRWEHGVTQPRAPYPKLLCQLFNAPAEELGLVSPAPSRTASTELLGQAAGGLSHVPSGDEL